MELNNAGDIITGLYFAVVIILSLASVYYSQRLTRLTGTFGAWRLLIVALICISFQEGSIGVIVLANPSQIQTLLQTTPGLEFLLPVLLGVAIPALIFFAMRKLCSLFEAKKTAEIKNPLQN